MAWEDRPHKAATSVDDSIIIRMQGTTESEWLDLGDILGMPPPTAFDVPLIDVTHMQTPPNTREFAGARPNPSQLQIRLGYRPGSEEEGRIKAAKGQTKTFRVEYRTASLVQTFDAVVINWAPGEVTAEGVRYEGVLTLQISGEVDEDDGT